MFRSLLLSAAPLLVALSVLAVPFAAQAQTTQGNTPNGTAYTVWGSQYYLRAYNSAGRFMGERGISDEPSRTANLRQITRRGHVAYYSVPYDETWLDQQIAERGHTIYLYLVNKQAGRSERIGIYAGP